MLKALIIERDGGLRQSICSHLAGMTMEVCGIEGAEALHRTLEARNFDIAICDADAGTDTQGGFALAAELRNRKLGIVMLSSSNRREDRILLLSAGADYLLPKPVDLQELGMVVRCLHQRLTPAAPAAVAEVRPRPAQAAADHWRFDATSWILTSPAGEAVKLSMAEHLVLKHLLSQPGRVASRDELMELLMRHNVRIYSRNLDAMISRLRKKTERAGSAERLPILSARNIGYVFTGVGEILGEAPRALPMPMSGPRSVHAA